jgi:prepilin-type processing-associated H-X9-DG protein
MLAASASAQDDAAEPLARYVPAEGLTILVEHNGFDARPAAWKGTAAYKMLNETSLGAMLEDITAQIVDRALQNQPGAPASGKEVVAILAHLARKGFALGYCGSLNPPQPKAGVAVIRDAAKNPVFKQVIARIPPLNEPAAKRVEQSGGRKVWMAAGPPIRWWYEKDDLVFSFAPPQAADPVVDALDGKVPSALKDPVHAALTKAVPGEVPVGLLFVDLTSMPPLSPRAGQLGLDGINRVEARWGIRDKGLVTTLAVQAPRPRRGILALFDQPPIGAGTKVAAPKGVSDYTLLSIAPIKFGDAVLAMVKQDDPNSAAAFAKFAERFRARTGLSLRDDLLGKLGPRMAVIAPPGGGGGSLMGMWFHPPDLGIVAEVKDAKKFAATLDRLMEAANRELKAAGAMVPPQPGQPSKPGTEFAEFRRLKAPDRGYVLSVPPSVLPTPAGLRPTVLVDLNRGMMALAGSPATARRVLTALVLNGAEAAPADRRDAVLLAQSDPSGTLPELLANLPPLVQFIGLAATQPGGPAAGMARPNGRPPFRLQFDPDATPDVEALRKQMFPSRFTIAVDDASIRLSAYQAFPLPVPQLNVGMESPVLIALLLPAVQSAREAARRSQCVNNLKQMGLAMHNYENVNGNFPAAAIVDKQGKPLLSWRVAILPYLEQKALYDKFKLDEPWDSPNNKELLKYMPSVYTCPSGTIARESGMTAYRVFSGPGALLEPTAPTRIAAVTDGLSNTVMVVESSQAVPWTKPDELPFGNAPDLQANPMFGAGSRHPGGLNALFADGSVRFLKSSINLQTLRALITKAGGEVVTADSY